MLNAESITVPFMCEQTKSFGSVGAINYVMTPRSLCQPSSFSPLDNIRKRFFSIHKTSRKSSHFQLELYSVYKTV